MTTNVTLRFVVITLFPEIFSVLTDAGVVARAHGDVWQLQCINPRDYADNKHRRVDERPYGGGPGMVMQAPPLKHSILAAKALLGNDRAFVVYMSPQGRVFNQLLAQQLADGVLNKNIEKNDSSQGVFRDYVVLCGRYEGVDERLLQRYVDFEISVGDYVLSGGEIAAMVIIDAVVRLLPGVCGHVDSAAEDSFSHQTLDYEQYTRPEIFEGMLVPTVLKSGNHKAIAKWRCQNAFERTQRRRPDLLVFRNVDEIT